METTTETPLLLNLDEVAEQLRCTRRSVERQIASQTLHVIRIGRSVRVERRELETFIAAHREACDGG
jgi:excisionase family DNA binding protein